MFEYVKEKFNYLVEQMVEDVHIIDFNEPMSFFNYLEAMLTSEWFWSAFVVYVIYKCVKFLLTGSWK